MAACFLTDPSACGPRTLIGTLPVRRSRQGTIELGQFTPSPDNLSMQERGKWTQENQDQIDVQVHQRVMDTLVHSWKERLSLISVITTFFAATEAQLLGNTTPPQGPSGVSPIEQAANAALMGALVVHVFAAIVSFLAAFFLIRYELREARRQEHKIDGGLEDSTTSSSSSPSAPGIFSTNPRLVRVGPLNGPRPPTHLLRQCHSLCICFAACGFVLALMGIICFAWAMMPTSVCIFSSVCAAVCFVTGLVAIL